MTDPFEIALLVCLILKCGHIIWHLEGESAFAVIIFDDVLCLEWICSIQSLCLLSKTLQTLNKDHVTASSSNLMCTTVYCISPQNCSHQTISERNLHSGCRSRSTLKKVGVHYIETHTCLQTWYIPIYRDPAADICYLRQDCPFIEFQIAVYRGDTRDEGIIALIVPQKGRLLSCCKRFKRRQEIFTCQSQLFTTMDVCFSCDYWSILPWHVDMILCTSKRERCHFHTAFACRL